MSPAVAAAIFIFSTPFVVFGPLIAVAVYTERKRAKEEEQAKMWAKLTESPKMTIVDGDTVSYKPSPAQGQIRRRLKVTLRG